ncbi:MAG TPA: hypothetical protein EYP62_03555 [Kiritimatiellae bacterium]|nr:hypothetical protein [Kiritimatiellia bacterium]
MQKIIALFLAVMFLVAGISAPAARAAQDAGAAAILSTMLPGVGEWYNRGWRGTYPWVECIAGYICCLVQISSVMDAANGNTDEGIRIDFWSAPVK